MAKLTVTDGIVTDNQFHKSLKLLSILCSYTNYNQSIITASYDN